MLPEEPNPFLRDITYDPVKVLMRQVNHKLIIDEDTEMNLVNKLDFEADDKLKFYTDNKRKNTCKILSPSASKLLLFILFKLEKNQDFVKFTIEEAEDFTGFSINTILKYIKELDDYAFVKRKGRETYWINPRNFFKGNRLEYFKESQKKFKEFKVLQDPVNLTEIAEGRRTNKKKEMMKYFGVTQFPKLKAKVGLEQIEAFIAGTIKLPEVKILQP
jgi:hypothetical protein